MQTWKAWTISTMTESVLYKEIKIQADTAEEAVKLAADALGVRPRHIAVMRD